MYINQKFRFYLVDLYNFFLEKIHKYLYKKSYATTCYQIKSVESSVNWFVLEIILYVFDEFIK